MNIDFHSRLGGLP